MATMSNQHSPWGPAEPTGGRSGGRDPRQPFNVGPEGAGSQHGQQVPSGQQGPSGQPWSSTGPNQGAQPFDAQYGANQYDANQYLGNQYDPSDPSAPQSASQSRPLGAQPLPSRSIDQYTLPRSRAPKVLWAVAALLVVALVAAGLWWNSRPPAAPEPTPTPSSSQPAPTPTANPSASTNSNATEFESVRDNARGTWQILDTNWTTRGLEVRVKITATQGDLPFGFLALDNVSADQFEPRITNESDDLGQGEVREGEIVTGLVVFHKPRNDTTVMLTDSSGRQISALIAKK